MTFNGLDRLSTGPGPRSFAGLVLIGSGPVFWTMQIYWDRSQSRSLLTGAKNRTGLDFQTLLTTPFVVVVLKDPVLAHTEPFRPFCDLTPVIVCIPRTADGQHHHQSGQAER